MDQEPTAVVHSQKQLVAAIKAAARLTYAEAKDAPALIVLGKARYSFPEGLTDRRAAEIAHNIMRTSASAFRVPEVPCGNP